MGFRDCMLYCLEQDSGNVLRLLNNYSFVPESSGQDLGSDSKRWNAYLDEINTSKITSLNGGLDVLQIKSEYLELDHEGENNIFIGIATTRHLTGTAVGNTGIGDYALGQLSSGKWNTCIGHFAGYCITSGNENMYLGRATGMMTTTGYCNIGDGRNSLANNTTGYANTGVGYYSLFHNKIGAYNVAVGANALQNFVPVSLGTGFNSALGAQAGFSNVTGLRNLYLGFRAGYYETGSDKFFIDNTARANEADARIKALMYGVFNANTGSQLLDVNANLCVLEKLTSKSGRIKKTTRVTASPYTVLVSDHIIFVDTDGGNITVNLPAGVNGTNYRIIACGSSGNVLTLVPNGAELLFGANFNITLFDGQSYDLVYETTEGWW